MRGSQLLLLLLLLIGTCAATKPQVILVLLADDLGFGDIGYNRPDPTDPEHATPNIDALAHSGVILDHHYVHFMCTPSRSSFLSGRLPMYVQWGQAFPETPSAGIPRNMTGIAAKLKQGGYATHAIGKWDAGMATPAHTPEGRGFDTSLVYFEHMNEYFTQQTTAGGTACDWADSNLIDLWDSGRPAYGQNGSAYIEYQFLDRFHRIIANYSGSEPLFIYYAPHIAHYPMEVPEDWFNKYAFVTDDEPDCNVTQPYIFPGSTASMYSCRRQHESLVGMLDWIVGNITVTLKAAQLWDSTLMVFASDNGAPLDLTEGGGSNTPLKGGKYSSWEGGIRSVGFVTGGFVPPAVRGTVQSGIVHLADWYGTFSALAGVDSYDPVANASGLPPVQSVNVWPLISGANTTWPRTELPISPQTLIQWPFKLVTGYNAFGTWAGSVYPNASSTSSITDAQDCGAGCLYDLSTDPTEHNDISSSNPTTVTAMSSRLNALVPTFFTNNDTGVDACPHNITLLCGCWMAVHHWGGFLGPYQL